MGDERTTGGLRKLGTGVVSGLAAVRAGRRLGREQWLSSKDLTARRRGRLRRVLARARKAPYYRAALEAAGIDRHTGAIPQVREEPGARLRVLLEPRQPPSAPQLESLRQALVQGVGADFAIELELVTRVPAAPSGKLQFLVPLAR